jgi:hypothetical protein
MRARSPRSRRSIPYLAEVVGHVATVGYHFTEAFAYGLDLILDALEQRRSTARKMNLAKHKK